MPSEDRIGVEPYRHLAARADENAVQDNPSPYLVLANGTRVDVGHVLLGLDALIHSTPAEDPFKTYQVPAIDPASWVADLGVRQYGWSSMSRAPSLTLRASYPARISMRITRCPLPTKTS
jgi:hypothetical protein